MLDSLFVIRSSNSGVLIMTDKTESLAKLTQCLALAISAPTDDHAARAIDLSYDLMAIAFNQGATDKDIEHCKKAAVVVVELLNQGA